MFSQNAERMHAKFCNVLKSTFKGCIFSSGVNTWESSLQAHPLSIDFNVALSVPVLGIEVVEKSQRQPRIGKGHSVVQHVVTQ